MNELIGKTIHALYVNDDESVLVFQTDHGDVVYRTYADCCSETWFADITGVDYLLGAAVIKAEEIDIAIAPDDTRTRQEYDEAYGVNLTTTKGYVNIVYRNSSNGYYGGSVEYLNDGRHPNVMIPIIRDWSAQS